MFDEYYYIINKYKKVIFSNYNDHLIAIKPNNVCEYTYYNNYVWNKFNQEINLLNNINLTHLNFGYKFDKEIVITLNVKSLTMVYCFN